MSDGNIFNEKIYQLFMVQSQGVTIKSGAQTEHSQDIWFLLSRPADKLTNSHLSDVWHIGENNNVGTGLERSCHGFRWTLLWELDRVWVAVSLSLLPGKGWISVLRKHAAWERTEGGACDGGSWIWLRYDHHPHHPAQDMVGTWVVLHFYAGYWRIMSLQYSLGPWTWKYSNIWRGFPVDFS